MPEAKPPARFNEHTDMKIEQRAAPPASPEVFQQLGAITRQLHDALRQLGVMPALQRAADGLPDARSRLRYVVEKTSAAADKVLDSVDRAKAEQSGIGAETRQLIDAITRNPVRAVASGSVMNFMRDLQAVGERTDNHLTDIMMAQDFHDLTGQVVQKVVALATDLEDHLVKLLVRAAPAEQAARLDPSRLDGPVVDPSSRTDVVADQGEVDDLLASLGF